MLKRSPYDSWQIRMILNIRGKEHGKLLLESVEKGPFQFGTILVRGTATTPATTRERTLDDLTPEEKICEACDIKSTNNILQVLPPDVYSLVNHHTVAKEIWDRVKLLMKGLVVPKFLPTDDPIESLNKAITFLIDLDAFDSDYDKAPTTRAAFMVNLTVYGLDILSELPNYDTYHDNTVFEQKKENEVVQSTTSPEQHDAMIMSIIEEMSNQVAKCNAANQENKFVNESLRVELERYKEMVKVFEERQKFELTDREKHIDS
ncbi:hypothetical protein Tco_0699789 [Tanacetum coccineum]